MPREFKAELIGNELVVKCISEKDHKGNLTVFAPNPTKIKALIKKEKQNGKRNIQQI